MPKKDKDLIGAQAADLACKKLQDKLNSKAKGDCLGKVALRLVQGLDAKATEFAKFRGKITERVDCVDFKTRATYCGLVTDIYGAKAPTKQELTGKDGEPLTVEIVRFGKGKAAK